MPETLCPALHIVRVVLLAALVIVVAQESYRTLGR